jgi:hypothetical protein
MTHLFDSACYVCYDLVTLEATAERGGDRIGPSIMGLRYSGGDIPARWSKRKSGAITYA